MAKSELTLAKILKGAGVLAGAGLIGGLAYWGLSSGDAPPDAPAETAEVAPEAAGEAADKAAQAANCPEIMLSMSAAQNWPEACGTGRPPNQVPPTLAGLWDVEAPGNPFLAELLVVLDRGHRGIGWRAADAALVASSVERAKDSGSYRSSGIKVSVSDDGVVSAAYGQYGFCNCRQIEFEVRPTGDPNVLAGRWSYRGKGDRVTSGPALWHRRPPARFQSFSYANKSADPTQRGTRDEVAFGGRPLRIERKHPVTCGAGLSRVNCHAVWITILGRNAAGGHDVWIDPASHMEIRDPGWICADGSGVSNWDKCGNRSAAADSVAGIRLRLVMWDGMTPGPRILWVDGQAAPLDIVLHGYPEGEERSEPALVSLVPRDSSGAEISTLSEGAAFALEATFDGEHPDSWVRLRMRPGEPGETGPSDGNGAEDPGSAQWVTLTRTSDLRVFRSTPLILLPEAD